MKSGTLELKERPYSGARMRKIHQKMIHLKVLRVIYAINYLLCTYFSEITINNNEQKSLTYGDWWRPIERANIVKVF